MANTVRASDGARAQMSETHGVAGYRFVKMPNDIIRDRTLSDAAKVLYAEIATYAWESVGSGCYASQARLADDLGWSVRKVQRAADELIAAARITAQRTGRTNTYHPCRIRNDSDDRSDTPKTTDQMRHVRRTKKTNYNYTKPTQTEGNGRPPEFSEVGLSEEFLERKVLEGKLYPREVEWLEKRVRVRRDLEAIRALSFGADTIEAEISDAEAIDDGPAA